MSNASERETKRVRGAGSLVGYLWTTAIAALAGFGTVYLALGPESKAGRLERESSSAGARAEQIVIAQAVAPSGPGMNALSTGHVAAFVFKKAPEALPEIAFTDAAGIRRTLADWQGRVVLLNLWATWCGPCRKEMPALDRLQKQLGSAKFEVVALAVDRASTDKIKKFLAETKVESLGLYIDSTVRASSALKAIGMPTTLLIDGEGREVGRLVGPAEWDSEDAMRLIRSAIK